MVPSPKMEVNQSAHEQSRYTQDHYWNDRDSLNDPQSSEALTETLPLSFFSPNDLEYLLQSDPAVPIARLVDGGPMASQNREPRQTEWDDDGFEASPSSQPSLVSESEETDKAMSDLASKEDLLAEFDVKSDEKEFLIEMLRVAPKDEVEMLQKARDTETDYDKPVSDFAKGHPIYEQLDGEVDEEVLILFQKDVYEFARATGMKRKKAKVDARRAVAAWIDYVGLGDSSFSEDEPEVKTGIPYLTSAKDYYKHDEDMGKAKTKYKKKKKKKKKKERRVEKHNESQEASGRVVDNGGTAPTFVAVSKPKSNAITSLVTREKRKRKSSEDGVDTGGSEERRKKRRKGLRHHEQEVGEMEFDRTTPTDVNDHATDISKTHCKSSTSDPTGLPAQQTAATSEKTKKMRPKPGPTTSVYFSNPKSSVERKIPRTDTTSTDSHLVLRAANLSSQAQRQARQSAAQNGAKMEQPTINIRETQSSLFPYPALVISDASNTAEATTHPISTPPKPQQNTIDEDIAEKTFTEPPRAHGPAVETAIPSKKHKRKRQRNQNRLHEAQTGTFAVDSERNGDQPVKGQDPQKEIPALHKYTLPLEIGVQSFHRHGENYRTQMPTEAPLEPSDNARYESERGQNKDSHIDSPIKRKRGGRCRPSKHQKAPDEAPSDVNRQGKPLTELKGDNGNGTTCSRRNRGRRRKHTPPAEPCIQLNGQQTKDRHS